MLECQVCGCKITPVIDKHYISKDNGVTGVFTVLKNEEGNLYDTFDCPTCGCQMIAQERKRIYVECAVENEKESSEMQEDDE